jgi:hypothetical protein
VPPSETLPVPDKPAEVLEELLVPVVDEGPLVPVPVPVPEVAA